MKRLILILSILIFNINYSQKIAVVSNINPIMGYTFAKTGLISFKPQIEDDLDFNLNDYTNEIFKDKNLDVKYFEDFNWDNLGYFDDYSKSKPILDYLQSYCNKKEIDELIIFRKYNSFKLIGVLDMFFYFKHNFGILTLNSYKKRALFYFNFGVYKYSLKENVIYLPNLKKGEYIDAYLTKKFDSEVFNQDTKKMSNSTMIIDYYLPQFKNYIKNTLYHLLDGKKTEVYIFKK
jgi:hypothetical protein